MSGVLNLCDKYFGTRDLYAILKIDKLASPTEVRNGYKRLSLLVHPDRVAEEEKTVSTEKFKVLGKIHSVLSDPEKRAIYDETGSVDEEDDVHIRDWDAYWRLLFKEIDVEDIDEYEKKYKDSAEELEDLKQAYLKFKGNKDSIMEYVPFACPEDESRLDKKIEELISSGELPAYDEFLNESPRKKERRKRKAQKEAIEAEKAKKEMEKKKGKHSLEKVEVENSALMAILKKKKEREAQADSFFQHLTEKYGKQKTGSKRKPKQ